MPLPGGGRNTTPRHHLNRGYAHYGREFYKESNPRRREELYMRNGSFECSSEGEETEGEILSSQKKDQGRILFLEKGKRGGVQNQGPRRLTRGHLCLRGRKSS